MLETQLRLLYEVWRGQFRSAILPPSPVIPSSESKLHFFMFSRNSIQTVHSRQTTRLRVDQRLARVRRKEQRLVPAEETVPPPP